MKNIALSIAALLLFACHHKPPTMIRATVFVSHTDTANTQHDINFLRGLPYITSVSFYSREAALREYEKDNDTTWKNILNDNPLPDSYKITINADLLPGGNIQSFKDTVMKSIFNVEDIATTKMPY